MMKKTNNLLNSAIRLSVAKNIRSEISRKKKNKFTADNLHRYFLFFSFSLLFVILSTGKIFACAPLTIALNSVSPSSVQVCTSAGASVTVNFSGTSNGAGSGTTNITYRAELSDAAGSFTAPVNIGSMVFSGCAPVSQVINATIPAGTISGTGYLIRVANAANAVVSSTSLGIIIINNTIVTGSISGSPFCGGIAVSVPFTTCGTINVGNTFTAQLSDATGSFATSVNIGTLAGTTSGTIAASIPIGTAIGAGYLIRVTSSNPAATGADNGTPLTVSSSSCPIISTVAGTGTAGSTGDGGLATAAKLNNPCGVAVDAAGNVYIADTYNNRVRVIDNSTGIINTVAGGGGSLGDGGLATAAQLNGPWRVAFDGSGNIYIGDRFNNRVRKIDKVTGIINTIAGTGTAGSTGDGGLATAAQLNNPCGVTVDAAGNVYIADMSNHKIRKIDKVTGNISTIAGTGTAGFSGDNGAATGAQLSYPYGIVFDGTTGNLYIADANNSRIRKIDNTGVISTMAGSGASLGDGGPATSAKLNFNDGVAVDAAGNVYTSDENQMRIREVTVSTGIINTIGGNGTQGFSGDGGPAVYATMAFPRDVAIDAACNNVYIADYLNHRVRKISGLGGCSVLPVKLLLFVGINDGMKNRIEWTTSSEINNDFFVLEHGTNGSDFDIMGLVKGAGNSSNEKKYYFIDEHPYQGINYYRLKQVDFNGNSTYSQIIALMVGQPNHLAINVYPNPASTVLNCELYSKEEEPVVIEVHDILGNVVIREEIKTVKGTNAKNLDISSLAQGMYFMEINNRAKQTQVKFVKQ